MALGGGGVLSLRPGVMILDEGGTLERTLYNKNGVEFAALSAPGTSWAQVPPKSKSESEREVLTGVATGSCPCACCTPETEEEAAEEEEVWCDVRVCTMRLLQVVV